MKIRTRFAPSPSGNLHLGSMRTAFYSWLYARKNKGEFVLRIENTDQKRSEEKFLSDITDSMKWLNIKWDKGPYFQIKRLSRYQKVLKNMLSKNIAYKCYCSKDRLAQLRKELILRGKKPQYDGYCRRYIGSSESINSNQSYAIRFLNPNTDRVSFRDLIHGNITCHNKELDDLVLCRTDGIPTYNFCVVIDDWDMEITHVIRGNDHINNTFRQINILNALDAPIPKYAHLPIITDINRKKLSKRNNEIGVMHYRNEGYLPEAILNHLLRLGWSNGNKEIFSQDEIINLFNLDKVNKSPSIFDKKKLLWVNRTLMSILSPEYIAEHLKWHIRRQKFNSFDGPNLVEVVKLLSNRFDTLKEMAENCRYYYEDIITFNDKLSKKYFTFASYGTLKKICLRFSLIDNWNISNIRHEILRLAKNQSMNHIGMPLRLALTGQEATPDLAVTAYLVGKKHTIKRINYALSYIKKDYFISKERYTT